MLIVLVTDMNSLPGSLICDYDFVQGHAYVKKMLKAIEIYKVGPSAQTNMVLTPVVLV